MIFPSSLLPSSSILFPLFPASWTFIALRVLRPYLSTSSPPSCARYLRAPVHFSSQSGSLFLIFTSLNVVCLPPPPTTYVKLYPSFMDFSPVCSGTREPFPEGFLLLFAPLTYPIVYFFFSSIKIYPSLSSSCFDYSYQSLFPSRYFPRSYIKASVPLPCRSTFPTFFLFLISRFSSYLRQPLFSFMLRSELFSGLMVTLSPNAG